MNGETAEALAGLARAVARLAAAVRALPDPDVATAGEWSARMVLAHVVFWHESFARNVTDLAAGRPPIPLRGTYAVLAERARAELGHLGLEALLARLTASQAMITRDIGARRIGLVPYRHGSRPYAKDEHLRVTTAHVDQHAAELERAARPTQARRRSAVDRGRSAAG